MKLKFKNIGKIKAAEVEIKKITLIAGLNTLEKVLLENFCIAFLTVFMILPRNLKKS